MYRAEIYEWPHPQIDQDWAAGQLQWREITPLSYRELKAAAALHESRDAFMQAELVDILADGEGLHGCHLSAHPNFWLTLMTLSH